ncbi:coiled-coil domain-containing protein 40 [Toxorhynchites rutilus septentrionalis]|uniref:coiled-coil domain-containing protein 40 n=1 Tax=Toxorhynchites rutilus septentrionalis TaxID=329112 RepID=UPI0024791D69|nr:coiled-coil domain-containing protein 40 [Toxorhynchites rutilus septentrionalis]
MHPDENPISISVQADEFNQSIVDQSGVLEKDHPLLERFQQALKAHLLRVQNQLEEEIAELDHRLEENEKESEEVGSRLYDLQEEIDSQKELLDIYGKEIMEVSERRQAEEQKVAAYKQEYDEQNCKLKDFKKIYNEHIQELDNLTVLESEFSKWDKEIKDEIAIAKRVASKDAKDQLVAAEEKRQVDLLVFNLDAEVRRKERELEGIEEQIKEQEGVTETINKSLADANSDLEALQHEHKRLFQAWGEVIVAIQQRDKVLSKTKDDLESVYEEHKVIKSKTDITKKAAAKEMEQNEKLSGFKSRIQGDINALEKQVIKEQEEDDKLTRELDHYALILEQTEADMLKAQQEGLLIENHLKSLRQTLNKQNQKKFELEEQILELLQDQITTDKAGESQGRTLRETQEKRRELEISMSDTENQLSIVLLELEKWRGIVERSKADVQNVKKEHDSMDEEARKYDEEIKVIKEIISAKLRKLDALNRQLEHLINQAGGHELNPDELRLLDVRHDINELDVKIKESQESWLKLQNSVVNLSEKRVQQLNEINYSRRKLLLVEQKAIKIEARLEEVLNENREIVRSLSTLNCRLDAVSMELFKTKKVHEKEEMECEISHQHTTERLKEAEMSVLNLEQDLQDLGKEIDDCKHEVLEKHREALSWETKYKMSAEAKKFKDEESAQNSEIGIMKAEIHRMQVRFAQLKRMQEKFVADLENTVHHREHIFDTVNAREKVYGSKFKTRSTMQHKINELKNKLKIVFGEISTAEKNLIEIDTAQKLLQAEIENKKQLIEEEKIQTKLIKSEVEQATLLKQENLDYIVRHQYRARRYRAFANANQHPKFRNEILIQADLQRQREINESIVGIVENLIVDFPGQKFNLVKILLNLK